MIECFTINSLGEHQRRGQPPCHAQAREDGLENKAAAAQVAGEAQEEAEDEGADQRHAAHCRMHGKAGMTSGMQVSG